MVIGISIGKERKIKCGGKWPIHFHNSKPKILHPSNIMTNWQIPIMESILNKFGGISTIALKLKSYTVVIRSLCILEIQLFILIYVMCCTILDLTITNGVRMVGQNAVVTS